MIREVWKKYILKKRKIFLKKNVEFKKAIFGGANRIESNTNIRRSKIGYGTYIGENCLLNMTEIGKFCSLGNNIRVVVGNHPTKDYVSTHPFCYSSSFDKEGLNFENHVKYDDILKVDNNISVLIGNDVWIGDNVLILGGTKIGDGAVIGCGSVITKNIEPYSVVVGVPGKELRKRFNSDQIKFLENFKWWDKDVKWLESCLL